MEMTQCRPKLGGARLMGTNSMATAAARVSDGNGGSWNDGTVSHLGPCYHSDEDINVSVLVPLESKSAGFSTVGQ